MQNRVIITGASSGIGQALTICLAKQGYDVLAIGRNEIALQRTKLLAGNDKVTTISADLTEDAELNKIARMLTSDTRINYLIHCAATTEPHRPLTAVTRPELEDTININVMAPIFLTQKLAPYFDKTTRVLFIGSDYVGISNKIRPNIAGSYGISKSALRVAVEYFRHEYKDTALIGYLNPGSTDTPMFHAIKTAIVSQQGVFNHAVQPAHPKQVAAFIQTILETASDQDYTTKDWDFRIDAPQQQIDTNKTSASITSTKAKL